MLFLGKELDLVSGRETGQRLLYDPDDLTTHAVCFGMTGSGKTGLCLVLIEEVIRSGVPVFLVDPKGDLANLLLTFPGLTPDEFLPWVDPAQARAAGVTVEQFAATTATRWREGLAASGLGSDDMRALRAAAEFTLYTPGSTAGTPLNVLGG
ncbi:MAG TPA: helicase HerA-like domain-containing protein, partial [Patescibacteria group bacterium]|nr:helicase HerA-like domain-containing protein [Patescibacteria group bacterium]